MTLGLSRQGPGEGRWGWVGGQGAQAALRAPHAASSDPQTEPLGRGPSGTFLVTTAFVSFSSQHNWKTATGFCSSSLKIPKTPTWRRVHGDGGAVGGSEQV